MQIKKLNLALMFAIAAPAAHAVDLSVGVPTENIMYFSGSDTVDGVLETALKQMCSVTLTVLTGSSGRSGWKCNASLGTTSARLPGVVGPWIVLKKPATSLQGINPLRTGQAVTQLDISNCTISGSTGTCSNTPVAKPVYLGFSDLSQKIYMARNELVTPVAGNSYIADISLGSGVGYGVVVSPALYTLLQLDQGTTSIPSISKSQYATLLTQTTGLWRVLAPNSPISNPPSTPLTLLSKSTNAVTDLYFLNNPCFAGTAPLGGALVSTVGSPAGKVFGSSADGPYIFKQENSDSAIIVDISSSTNYVIGVLPLTQPQNGFWKFLPIGGDTTHSIHPGFANAPDFQRKNIVNGKYDFYYENFIHQNTSSSIPAVIQNNITNFKNALVAYFGVGANLSTTNGIFVDPLAPNADFGVETNHYSRAGNECSTPIHYWP